LLWAKKRKYLQFSAKKNKWIIIAAYSVAISTRFLHRLWVARASLGQKGVVAAELPAGWPKAGRQQE